MGVLLAGGDLNDKWLFWWCRSTDSQWIRATHWCTCGGILCQTKTFLATFFRVLLGWGGPNRYFGGCCAASSHHLTMGSQRYQLAHRWNAFLSYKVCCGSDIWWCSWAGGSQIAVFWCWKVQLYEFSMDHHGTTTQSIRTPVANGFVYKVLCGVNI